MKDKIRQIIKESHKKDHLLGGREVLRYDIAGERLTSLMCYREAKAFIAGLKEGPWLPDLIAYMEEQGYSIETIWVAIHKIENEQT